MGRRIGIFGGTFDPVHIAHLLVASEVKWRLGLDVVLLMVAGEPWQKSGRLGMAPADDRLAVVAAAVEDLDGLEASSLEIDRGGATYTADTLAQLHATEPGAELFLVIGADVARLLHTWDRPDEVRTAATLVVVARPGSPAAPLDQLRREGWMIAEVDVPAFDVSSSEVRARLADGRPIDVLVPPAAVREIVRRGRYARTG